MNQTQAVRWPPAFDKSFLETFRELLVWRRDVRRFRTNLVPDPVVDELIALANLAPSVGNSQPWRLVRVRSNENRAVVRDSFERSNSQALAGYAGERAELYSKLKLSGLETAPVQLAIFCDESTAQGHGLGRCTMPETLTWSVVGMIQILWLLARARGLGVGWVSILDPIEVTSALSVPCEWKLVAYLCIGWPEQAQDVPELEQFGWQSRTDAGQYVLDR